MRVRLLFPPAKQLATIRANSDHQPVKSRPMRKHASVNVSYYIDDYDNDKI